MTAEPSAQPLSIAEQFDALTDQFDRGSAFLQILRLHRPENEHDGYRTVCAACGGIDVPIEWPCLTTMLIAETLPNMGGLVL